MAANISLTYWNVFCKKSLGKKEDFAMENRMLNMACITLLVVLVFFLGLNMFTGLWRRSILLLIIFACELIVYYYSRFKKKYTTGLIINGIVSYAALAVNYYLNSGINGPTLFLFFFTIHTLVSGTPDRFHPLWLVLHIATVSFILTAEQVTPSLIKYSYSTEISRMADMTAVYVVSILFIFQLTRYLRAYYDEEKTLADEYSLKLKAFFDSSDDGHVLLDKNFNIVYFNHKISAFIRNAYKKDLAAGKRIFDYITPSYVEQCKKNFTEALMGNVVHEQRMIHYDRLGNIWWNISFMPVRDNDSEVVGLSFNTVDITASKQQEQELQARHRSLLKIADIQSHALTQPVSTIIRLMEQIKTHNTGIEENLALMETATLELDDYICKIVAQTKTTVSES